MANPHLSIIIPAYNEEGRLPETLALVRDYVETRPYSVEVLVADDGSKDSTVAMAEHFSERFPQLKVLQAEKNGGKGSAVKRGMLAATGEIRLFMDADYSTPLSELEKLLPFTKEFPVVIGSRHLHPDSIKIKQSLKRRIISRVGNRLIQQLILPGISDTQCGFKLFTANAADAIFARQTMTGWGFDMEILTIAKQLGLAVKEVPVDWYDAKQSKLQAVRSAKESYRDLHTIHKRVKKNYYK
jgi:dolichyl-phosphate beta-glucosyltransferase